MLRRQRPRIVAQPEFLAAIAQPFFPPGVLIVVSFDGIHRNHFEHPPQRRSQKNASDKRIADDLGFEHRDAEIEQQARPSCVNLKSPYFLMQIDEAHREQTFPAIGRVVAVRSQPLRRTEQFARLLIIVDDLEPEKGNRARIEIMQNDRVGNGVCRNRSQLEAHGSRSLIGLQDNAGVFGEPQTI
ncbi:MAG: hypothetical protein ACREDU_00480 [Methylocella sp.]